MQRLVYIFATLFVAFAHARIHKLEITNDARRYIALSTFGFYKGGALSVNLKQFQAEHITESSVFGFSLDRTKVDGMNKYIDNHQERCLLEDENAIGPDNDGTLIFIILDLKNNQFHVRCKEAESIHIYRSPDQKDKALVNSCQLNIDFTRGPDGELKNATFFMAVEHDDEEGLYNLYFHSCPNYNPTTETEINFKMEIVERNFNSFLSAGELPLPALYFMMSVLFVLSGMFWVFLLRQSKHPVFKIHYMMTILVFLKAISLAFHGVNYHYINQLGVHLATWAILFYVAHLLKGAVLFVVLVLVGTGWTFIKHVLTPRDKRLFMAVIPLQVLANIAEIILEESEEGAREYFAWRNVVTLVDLLCCGCIMFPVVWSIRHLQEASHTDGKAAMNLRKLKLFRHFYVMIVCYIYSTRIIVYLLKMTVPFQYGWLHEMFREMSTYVFFVLTAYKFRPASQNPYFALNEDDDDEDMDTVLTETGATEGLKKVNSRVTKVPLHTTITEVTEEEKDALLGQRESSHDYD